MEYRRTIELDLETPRWFVKLGPLDHLNPESGYPFPTEFAAFRFAASHKRRAPHRCVAITSPDGSRQELSLPGSLPDIGDENE